MSKESAKRHWGVDTYSSGVHRGEGKRRCRRSLPTSYSVSTFVEQSPHEEELNMSCTSLEMNRTA